LIMSRMLLAVDTATQSCGLAIIIDGIVQTELILNRRGTHTKQILAGIDTVLSLSESSLEQIEAFAVTRGPGSFTGLRIGISTVKGLSLATGKPLIGVSSLDVLAHQAGGNAARVCSMIDARRNEIYWRVYRREDGKPISQSDEQVGPVDRMARQIDDACVFVGNAVLQYGGQLSQWVKQAIQIVPDADNLIRPAVLAQLAWRRFLQGDVDDVEAFAPVYLRKSDAELKYGA
jgi:tRNA threonylcarbamoyladenosine biosynthesis protein TsaB